MQTSLRVTDSLTDWGEEKFVVLCLNTTLVTVAMLAEGRYEGVANAMTLEVGHVTVNVGVDREFCLLQRQAFCVAFGGVTARLASIVIEIMALTPDWPGREVKCFISKEGNLAFNSSNRPGLAPMRISLDESLRPKPDQAILTI